MNVGSSALLRAREPGSWRCSERRGAISALRVRVRAKGETLADAFLVLIVRTTLYTLPLTIIATDCLLWSLGLHSLV